MQVNTISLDSVLGMLTSLSADNKKWLADKLYEQVEATHTCELDEALKAAHTEKLYSADSIEQLMKDLMK